MNLKVVGSITAIVLGMLTFNAHAQWHAPDLQAQRISRQHLAVVCRMAVGKKVFFLKA